MARPKGSRKAKAGQSPTETTPTQAGTPAQQIADEERDAIAPAPAGAVAPAQSTPEGSISMVVGKIGWDNGNESSSVVLIDKRSRAKIGVDIREPVIVSKGETKVLSFVALQFWELVGTGKATINQRLAGQLSASVGEEIKISKLSPTERGEFDRQQQERMSQMTGLFGAIMGQAQRGQGE